MPKLNLRNPNRRVGGAYTYAAVPESPGQGGGPTGSQSSAAVGRHSQQPAPEPEPEPDLSPMVQEERTPPKLGPSQQSNTTHDGWKTPHISKQARRARQNEQPRDTIPRAGSSESQSKFLTRTPGTWKTRSRVNDDLDEDGDIQNWRPFARPLSWRGRKHAHTDRVKNCCFFDNGKKALSCGDDYGLRIWDLDDEEASHRCIGVLGGKDVVPAKEEEGCPVLVDGGHTDLVRDCVVYRVDGDGVWVDDKDENREVIESALEHRWMALSCSADKSMKVWELGVFEKFESTPGQLKWKSTCELKLTVNNAHDDWVVECSVFLYKPDGTDGKIIALSCSSDGTLKTWNLSRLSEMASELESESDSDAEKARIPAEFTGADEHTSLCKEQGHSDWVMGCCVYDDFEDSKTQHMALSSSADFTLKLWRFEALMESSPPTAQCVRTLAGHSGWVNACRVFANVGEDSDGSAWKALSGSDDTEIRLWYLSGPSAGKCERVLKGHTDVVIACEPIIRAGMRPLAVSTSGDTSIRVWSLETGECEVKLMDSGCAGRTRGCDVWVDPTTQDVMVLTCSADKSLRLWDLSARHTHQQTKKFHNGAVAACQVYDHKTGSKMISGGRDGCLYSWQMSTGKMLWKFTEVKVKPNALDPADSREFRRERLDQKITGCAVFQSTEPSAEMIDRPGETSLQSPIQRSRSSADTPLAASTTLATTSWTRMLCSCANEGKHFSNLMVFAVPDPTKASHHKLVEPILTLKGHKAAVLGSCVLKHDKHDGHVAVSCSADKTLKVWLLTEENLAEKLTQQKETVITLIKKQREKQRKRLQHETADPEQFEADLSIKDMTLEQLKKQAADDGVVDWEMHLVDLIDTPLVCEATIQVHTDKVLACCVFKQEGKWKILSSGADSLSIITDLDDALNSPTITTPGSEHYRQHLLKKHEWKLGSDFDRGTGHTKPVNACCVFGGATGDDIQKACKGKTDPEIRLALIDLIVGNEKKAHTGDELEANFDKELKKKLDKVDDVALKMRAREPTRALTCSDDGDLRVWSLRGDHSCVCVLRENISPVKSCSVSLQRGSEWRAISCSKRTVSASVLRVWDLSEESPRFGEELVTGRRIFSVDIMCVAVAAPSFTRGTFSVIVGLADGEIHMHDLSNAGIKPSPQEMWKALPLMSAEQWAEWAIKCIEECSPHFLYQKFELFDTSDDSDNFETLLHLLARHDRDKSTAILRSMLEYFQASRINAIAGDHLEVVDLAKVWAKDVGLDGKLLSESERKDAQRIQKGILGEVVKAAATIGLAGRASKAGGERTVLAETCKNLNEGYAKLLFDDFTSAVEQNKRSDDISVDFLSEHDVVQALVAFPDMTEHFLQGLSLCTAPSLVSRERHYKFRSSDSWKVLAHAKQAPSASGTKETHRLVLSEHTEVDTSLFSNLRHAAQRSPTCRCCDNVRLLKALERAEDQQKTTSRKQSHGPLILEGAGAEAIIESSGSSGVIGLILKREGSQAPAIRVFQDGERWAVQVVAHQLNDIFVIRRGSEPARVPQSPGRKYLENRDKIQARVEMSLTAWLGHQHLEDHEDEIVDYLAIDRSGRTNALDVLKSMGEDEIEELKDSLIVNGASKFLLESFGERVVALKEAGHDTQVFSDRLLLGKSMLVKITVLEHFKFWDEHVEKDYHLDLYKDLKVPKLKGAQSYGGIHNMHRRQSEAKWEADKEASLVRAEVVPFVGSVATKTSSLTQNHDGTSSRDTRKNLGSDLEETEETEETEDTEETEEETVRLPFYTILGAAVNHAKVGGSPAIFKAPALKVIVQHKWEQSTSLLYRAQFVGYLVFLALFTALMVFDEMDIGALNAEEGKETTTWTATLIHGAWWYCLVYSVLLFKFELHQVRC